MVLRWSWGDCLVDERAHRRPVVALELGVVHLMRCDGGGGGDDDGDGGGGDNHDGGGCCGVGGDNNLIVMSMAVVIVATMQTLSWQ